MGSTGRRILSPKHSPGARTPCSPPVPAHEPPAGPPATGHTWPFPARPLPVPPRPPHSGLTGWCPDLATLSPYLPTCAQATSPPAPALSLPRVPVCLRAQQEQAPPCDFPHAPSESPTHWTPLPQRAGRPVGAAVGTASSLPSCLSAGVPKGRASEKRARLRRQRGRQDGVQARGGGGVKRGVAVAGVWLPLSGSHPEARGLAFYTPHAR